MKATLKFFPLFIALMLMLQVFSCKKKAMIAPAPPQDTTQTYFSIRGFIKDQLLLLNGQPYSLNEFTTRDGHTDSTMVNFYTMDLGYVLKSFLATDIGSPKMLGKYRFSTFEENTTGNQIFMYEAKEPELFTRTFSFTVDPTNDRILSLYAEAADHDMYQRLLYIPLKVIQIQENRGSSAGKARNYRLEYRFLQ